MKWQPCHRGAAPREKQRRARKRGARQDLRHIRSVLALCGLPYSRQPLEEREYRSKQGSMRLIVNAGELLSPRGEFVKQPLPYGSRARLLLLHLCSEAIRQQSPTIKIDASLTAFIKKMGFGANGGQRGNLIAFKQQLNALAACKMTIGTFDEKGGHTKTVDTAPFESMDVWFPTHPDQQMLWASTITFSREFYDTLARHALPVNVHAIRAFSGLAAQDRHLLLARPPLLQLGEPVSISWKALKEQFGEGHFVTSGKTGGYTRDRDFRAKFTKELAHICELFPKLPVAVNEGGIRLKPADSDALSLPAKSSTKSVKP
ncbi:replication protein RepA [Rhizobium beringeri]